MPSSGECTASSWGEAAASSTSPLSESADEEEQSSPVSVLLREPRCRRPDASLCLTTEDTLAGAILEKSLKAAGLLDCAWDLCGVHAEVVQRLDSKGQATALLATLDRAARSV